VLIKKGRREAHKLCMLGAVASSAVFLACYLYYHFHAGSVRYSGPWRPLYLGILLSHTVLAAAVLPLLYRALIPALREDYALHSPRAKILLPVWLYVSVTGVVVYAMLYRL
jgi:uncharacterized membrane protein YozB (DUF420 family)